MTRNPSGKFPAVARHAPGGEQGTSVGLVSTFRPTSCGLATFAEALGRGMAVAGASRVGTVRCLQPGDSVRSSAGVEWRPGDAAGLRDAGRYLNEHDVVVLQHEYGIYGEMDGRAVLDLLDRVDTPVITTLHTVPARPTSSQRLILEEVTTRSCATVVMTEAARRRLIDGYAVNPLTIHNIPHGATRPPVVHRNGQAPSYALTWGLLGPGKGIEWVVDALAMAPLADVPSQYRVVGRTHPKVADRDGDAYLDMLKRRARMLGVEHSVVFDTNYHPLERLLDIVARASVVVLPYESTDQITSGVLVDAIAAGVPVVATRFPHAVELLRDGAGILVPFGDSAALAEAIHRVVSYPAQRERMAVRARELGLEHDWVTVARSYLNLAAALGAGGGRLLAAEGRQ